MPDIIIEPAATATSEFMRQSMNGRDCVDVGLKRYQFYISGSGTVFDYKLSNDEGATYGAAVNIYTDALIPIKKASIHFDQWTRNDFGTIITIFLLARGGVTSVTNAYRLDTSTDVLTGPFDFLPNAGGVSATAGWQGANRSALGVTKSETGRWHAVGWIDNGVGDQYHSVSTDGITWDDTTHQNLQAATPSEGFSAIKVLLVPDNDVVGGDDIWCILMDGVPRVQYRKYDFSALTWGAQTVISAIATNSDVYFQMGVCQYFATGSFFLVFWTDFNVATADYLCFELESSTVATARTAVLTNFNSTFGAGIQVDQSNGNLYGVHFNGTPEATVSVFQDVNITGGVGAWVRSQYDQGVADDMRWISLPPSGSTTGSRFMPAWRNDDLDDIISNFDQQTPLGDTPTTPPAPVPPPEIVPPGGTYGPAPGAPPGTIVYITPDDIEYPLVTPHPTGRFVMSFSGFGMAPIQYISQRGPNQDGETVRDFNLTPRVVQLLERQQFKSRDAWWDGRADILNDLRPNRQLVATAVVPGVLRMVRSDGSLRDLNVFIQEGPRFEARNVEAWDEWAFEEVLRFVAHDPLFFDPTRVDFSLAFTLAAALVFPITFDAAVPTDDIIFGSGEIDETFNLDYTGTWASLPTIVIVGPLEGPIIIDNVTTGEKIELLQDIGPGVTVTIDLAFGQKTITDQDGNNLLGSLSTDSDLGTWHIAPTPEAPQVAGQPRPTARNVIRLRGTNPTGPTSVEVRYFTRYVGI